MPSDQPDRQQAAYGEDDLLPLSGLQHLAYCPRQFALIHIEHTWSENRFTAEGQLLHRRVDGGASENRGSLHYGRSLRLHSFRLGLSGIADVVEFSRSPAGIPLPGKQGLWHPRPIEYKRGRPKGSDIDKIQLCAQALCLEEMLDCAIPCGDLYYGKTRRRANVDFTESLRYRVSELSNTMHRLFRAGDTPPPEPGPKCDYCSLQAQCAPSLGDGNTRLTAYLEQLFKDEP